MLCQSVDSVVFFARPDLRLFAAKIPFRRSSLNRLRLPQKLSLFLNQFQRNKLLSLCLDQTAERRSGRFEA